MTGKYSADDAKAFQLAQEKFERTDPTERYSFQRYLEDAYAHVQAQKNPGEGPADPWAD